MPPRLVTAACALMLTVGATHATDPRPSLADAGQAEMGTLARLRTSESWARRAIAAVRLERYGDARSRAMLVTSLDDRSWQVRAFAARSLGRRREPADPAWFTLEQDPRVLRAALRHRYAVDVERLARGVRNLAKSRDVADRLLAAELAAASGDEELEEQARELTRQVILRMSRVEAGVLSPRLAALTGQRNLHRAHRWQRWLLKSGRGFDVDAALLVGDAERPDPPARIATLDVETFGALERYIEELATRTVDLAICLDCTASMSGELAAVQAGIDDLMLFVGDVVHAFRLGLVAYRDRRDRFKTRGWGFTDEIGTARSRLWSLEAEGGGDSREAVYDGMKLALTEMAWEREHTNVLVVIGDAPPHVGYGTQCVELAGRAAGQGLVTHAIQADGKPVDHFEEIAEAGKGRCVALENDDVLIAEIAGLTLGEMFEEEFREFFRIYLDLCR
jgi:hypothetical protein